MPILKRRLITETIQSKPLAMPITTPTLAISWIPRISKTLALSKISDKIDQEDIIIQNYPTKEFASNIDSLVISETSAGTKQSLTRKNKSRLILSRNLTFLSTLMTMAQVMIKLTFKNRITQ